MEQVACKSAAGVAPPASNTAEAGDHVDLSRDITELLVARESFEANIKVLETIDEIDGHVLDLLA
ncbi:MAG: flagellar basal body rod C-terminal domain-containing protein [Bryobacteraceae bacterium]